MMTTFKDQIYFFPWVCIEFTSSARNCYFTTLTGARNNHRRFTISGIYTETWSRYLNPTPMVPCLLGLSFASDKETCSSWIRRQWVSLLDHYHMAVWKYTIFLAAVNSMDSRPNGPKNQQIFLSCTFQITELFWTWVRVVKPLHGIWAALAKILDLCPIHGRFYLFFRLLGCPVGPWCQVCVCHTLVAEVTRNLSWCTSQSMKELSDTHVFFFTTFMGVWQTVGGHLLKL